MAYKKEREEQCWSHGIRGHILKEPSTTTPQRHTAIRQELGKRRMGTTSLTFILRHERRVREKLRRHREDRELLAFVHLPAVDSVHIGLLLQVEVPV